MNSTPKALSEHKSRQVLEPFGIPLVQSVLTSSLTEAKKAAREIGYPLVLKATGDKLLHKTEMSLVKLGLVDEAGVEEAFLQIIDSVADENLEGVLVQPYIKSSREFIAGMKRDEHFGPCVLFGLGGIFSEAMEDVVFRVAPLEERDALEMLDEIKASSILCELRGEPGADRQALARLLMAVGTLGLENDQVQEIDLNPIVLDGSQPLAVDALVIMK